MTDLVVVEEIQVLTELADDQVVVEELEVIEILTDAAQGPEGKRGPQGPAGGVTLVPVGPAAISGHSAVAVNADGELIPADCTQVPHRGAVLGVVSDAYVAGADAEVKTGFPMEHLGWTWSPGPIFVGASGQLVQALPPGAAFSQVVGLALSPTRVLVDLQPPIAIA